MDSSLTIDVAGVILNVLLPNITWAPSLHARYHTFLTPAEPHWQITLHHDPSLRETMTPWVRHEDTITHFRISTFGGWIDLAARRAAVSTPSEERALSALERAFTYICMQALPRDHASLLLHAVGVIVGGVGLVFCGPSGAGKSTIAGLAQGIGRVVSDENIVLRPRGTGVELHSTPFWGHSSPPALVDRTRVAPVPLAGLFVLAHAPSFALTPLSSADAIVSLLLTEKVATERAASAEAWLNVAQMLVERCPVHHLAFPPTRDLWHFLAAAGFFPATSISMTQDIPPVACEVV